jgi:hypothetical protein
MPVVLLFYCLLILSYPILSHAKDDVLICQNNICPISIVFPKTIREFSIILDIKSRLWLIELFFSDFLHLIEGDVTFDNFENFVMNSNSIGFLWFGKVSPITIWMIPSRQTKVMPIFQIMIALTIPHFILNVDFIKVINRLQQFCSSCNRLHKSIASLSWLSCIVIRQSFDFF